MGVLKNDVITFHSTSQWVYEADTYKWRSAIKSCHNLFDDGPVIAKSTEDPLPPKVWWASQEYPLGITKEGKA